MATPIKYMFNDPYYVKLLGMPHGILFILYLAVACFIKINTSWLRNNFKIVLLASIVPFGTFYIDFKYLKHL